MKKVIIVGGGASGIFTALLLSKKEPSVSIEIIENNLKLGKKLRATGNGHANLLNENLDRCSFNPTSSLINGVLSAFSVNDLLNQYQKWNILTISKDGLYYPMSYHAPSFVNHLTKQLIENGVKISLGVEVNDYSINEDGVLVKTSDGDRLCDDIIFTSGGISSSKFGSGCSIFSLLEAKGYQLTSLEPGLTPIRVKERIIKPLVGVRHKALVSLKDDKGLSRYEEDGEIIFRKDGLSGICIMNIASQIKWLNLRTPEIHIDLLPGVDVSKNIDEKTENEAVIEHPLYSEVLYQAKKRGISFNAALHDVVYFYESSYGFEESQVTIGGLDDSSVSSNLSSKLEKHVYFAGEILNVDGLCGGFNLAWALMSAMLVSRSI